MTISINPTNITLNSGYILPTRYAYAEGINAVVSSNTVTLDGKMSFGGPNESIEFIHNVTDLVTEKTYPIENPETVIGYFSTAGDVVTLRNWLSTSINASTGKETNANIQYYVNDSTYRYITSMSGSINMSSIPTVADSWNYSHYYTILGINVGVDATYPTYTINGSPITPTNIGSGAFSGSILDYSINYANISAPIDTASNISYTFTKASSNMWSQQMVYVLPGLWLPAGFYSTAGAPSVTFYVKKWDVLYITVATGVNGAFLWSSPTGVSLNRISDRGGYWYGSARSIVYIVQEDGVLTVTTPSYSTQSLNRWVTEYYTSLCKLFRMDNKL